MSLPPLLSHIEDFKTVFTVLHSTGKEYCGEKKPVNSLAMSLGKELKGIPLFLSDNQVAGFCNVPSVHRCGSF